MQSGCLVVNAPTANTIAAAEHGIALIAALSRNVAQADASVKAGKWERTKYVGVSIIGKTLAIMGFGKVDCFIYALPNPCTLRADGSRAQLAVFVKVNGSLNVLSQSNEGSWVIQ